jgi:hypothetical protein
MSDPVTLGRSWHIFTVRPLYHNGGAQHIHGTSHLMTDHQVVVYTTLRPYLKRITSRHPGQEVSQNKRCLKPPERPQSRRRTPLDRYTTVEKLTRHNKLGVDHANRGQRDHHAAFTPTNQTPRDNQQATKMYLSGSPPDPSASLRHHPMLSPPARPSFLPAVVLPAHKVPLQSPHHRLRLRLVVNPGTLPCGRPETQPELRSCGEGAANLEAGEARLAL